MTILKKGTKANKPILTEKTFKPLEKPTRLNPDRTKKKDTTLLQSKCCKDSDCKVIIRQQVIRTLVECLKCGKKYNYEEV